MHKDGDEVHLSTEEARGASTPRVTRYVLSISLLLVIIVFAVLFAIWKFKVQV